MTPKSVTKTLILASSDIGITMAVGAALNKAVVRVAPSLTEWDEEWTRKEKAIQTAKLLGLTVGIAVAAGAVATAVHNVIDENLWNEDEEVYEIEN